VYSEEAQAAVAFEGLPTTPIYTLAMDVPISWVVRPREAQHDLDNIQLSHLRADEAVDAVFDLDYLVVEGHAREELTRAAPRGLQLQLSTRDGTAVDDTQVVANLGYLQFKAVPGVFRLEIRAGRGREIFAMESVGAEGWDSLTVAEGGDEVAVTSFDGLVLYPRLRRLPGMDYADVLQEAPEEIEEDEEPSGLIDNVLSRFGFR
jgi:UDP-glucose:glycoprotein glucosyltransferase